MLDLTRKIFGSSNDRKIKRLDPRVAKINALESDYQNLTDEVLRAKTVELRDKVRQAIEAVPENQVEKRKAVQAAVLDEILEPAFAIVREAAQRALGQRHYDVQLKGGILLHEGGIAEMRTGEGKTLVATLPVYLNALTGRGVHVVTVNDYLAKRDAEWMGQVYKFLGLTVGCIVHGLTEAERRQAYASDVTYGTNNEFGFDYLRDNMKYAIPEMCQRGHHFAIVDEVDSILIDEARTPLIISGPTDDRSEFYRTIDEIVRETLTPDDFEIDEKQRSVALTEAGNERVEDVLKEKGLLEGESLYDIANVSVVHHINQALRAHKLFQRDKDYIVKGDGVVLIDEFTGRMMEGRRLSEGLHQAIEAKEKVSIQPENVTLASITFQNYFRLYDKLAGMTGTAATEADEFFSIYKLDVSEIPTNRPVERIDEDDEVYRTADEKYKAILDDLVNCHDKGQPILVGTVSIEKSEVLASLLEERGYKRLDVDDPEAVLEQNRAVLKGGNPKAFTVLNARYHEQEALIVAQAGIPGAITIATNMAGRGTDIQLGGNLDMRLAREVDDTLDAGARERAVESIREEVYQLKQKALAAGGLYVLGTERHESRRIDNQLRGRTGRQGDPGRSKFYVSVDDDLMRIFAPERMNAIMKGLGMKEGEAIVHPWMSKALETAQKRVEQRNFEIRKNLLKYDDVINDQRKAIFEQRRDFMKSENVGETVREMRHELVDEIVARHVPAKAYADQWNIEGLAGDVEALFGVAPPVREWASEEGIADEEIRERLTKAVDEAYALKVASAPPGVMPRAEKQILLQVIDNHWREHLQQLDHLRSVVHLRGYGQRDPLNEFKTEAFALFEKLLAELRQDVTRILMNIRIQMEPPPAARPPAQTLETHIDPHTGRNEMAAAPTPPQAAARTAELRGRGDRIGRNEPCPCGSGKKFKHCHGAVSAEA